jgi:hypothetical protein
MAQCTVHGRYAYSQDRRPFLGIGIAPDTKDTVIHCLLAFDSLQLAADSRLQMVHGALEAAAVELTSPWVPEL